MCAIAYAKQRITNFDVEDMMKQFVGKNVVLSENGNSVLEKPPIPPEIRKLMEMDELSSSQLRSEANSLDTV